MPVRPSRPAAGLLSRLARDTRGNALMFMAAILIPMMAFSGSAIDMARIYTVKSRLQQACDAGVLAGRKSLNGTTLDTSPTGQAQTFFNNNFNSGWLGTTAVAFNPSLTSDNQVQANATANVPMTIMAMFGQKTRTLTVNCTARYDVADADIMFVLDTTGSMACLPSDSNSTCQNYDVAVSTQSNPPTDQYGPYITEKSGSRAAGVRSAVLQFFDTVTSQADQTTNFRFGFVPFNVAVNVGQELYKAGYMATSWTYQSREVVGDANNGNASSAQDVTSTSPTQTACVGTSPTVVNGGLQNVVRTPAAAPPWTYDANGNAVNTTYRWASNKCTKSTQALIPKWSYQNESGFPVAQYLKSTAQTPIDNPAQVATSYTSYWTGCVEERGTPAGIMTIDAGNPPLDLDVDADPSGYSMGPPTNAKNGYWGPMWTDVQFGRSTNGETSSDGRDIWYRPASYYQSLYERVYEGIACPAAAVSRLNKITLPGNTDSGGRSSATAAARSQIQSYLTAANGYRPWGSTYLDEGMVWGARMISPSGLFKGDTSAWPGHNAPNRYLIFLTDGGMESDCYADAAHGMENLDQRVTGTTCTGTNPDSYHLNRLAAACTIAKNHNITVFTIVFGQSVTGLSTQFTNCSSPGQTYIASDTTALNTAFSKIAQQVAMLRLSK